MESNTLVHSIEITKCITSTISIFLNCFGIFLLRKYYNKEKNQDFILMTLSSVEIFIAVIWILSTVLQFYHMYDGGSLAWKVVYSFRTGTYLIWYAIIYMLTLDRFLGCNFPLRHRELTLKTDMRITMVIVWVSGVILSIVFCVVDTSKVYLVFLRYIWIIIDSLYLLLFIITYTSIFCKIRRSRASNVQRNSKNGQQQFIKIITSLIVAFVILETNPTIIRMSFRYAKQRHMDIVEAVMTMLYTIHLSVDPLIYIFLKPKSMQCVRKWFVTIGVRRSRVYSFRKSDIRDEVPQTDETSFQNQKASYSKKDDS